MGKKAKTLQALERREVVRQKKRTDLDALKAALDERLHAQITTCLEQYDMPFRYWITAQLEVWMMLQEQRHA